MSGNNGRHRPQLRDVSHERAFTITAAAAVDRSPVPIIRLSEQRAPLTPIDDFVTRDLILDALEELADCRNYIDWEALRLDLARHANPDARIARAALQRALGHVVEAFAELTLARSVTSGLETVGAES